MSVLNVIALAAADTLQPAHPNRDKPWCALFESGPPSSTPFLYKEYPKEPPIKISKIILSIVLMILVSSPSSWGFEKKAHFEISKRALEIYKELYPQKSRPLHQSSALFTESSSKEDDISFSLQRLFNWHFYDPGHRLGHAWWGARKSNSKRFEFLAAKLTHSKAKGPSDIYEIGGRLAHHIQDMSSPPHAVPVYHIARDPFDKYATAEIADIKLTSAKRAALNNEQRHFEFNTLIELLDDAATRTIDRVEKPVRFEGRIIASDWTCFWRKYELTSAECGQKPHNGFGCYGKKTFGVDAGPFTEPVYQRFYKEQIASAIEDTVRLLILLDNVD